MDRRAETRRRFLIGLAVAGSACLAGVAQGQTVEGQDPRTVMVSFGDLDLATLAGAQTLYARIEGAAQLVCGEQGRSIEEQTAWEACMKDAIDGAVAAVHSPLLSNVADSVEGNLTMVLSANALRWF
jgi:UrcA family protein